MRQKVNTQVSDFQPIVFMKDVYELNGIPSGWTWKHTRFNSIQDI